MLRLIRPVVRNWPLKLAALVVAVLLYGGLVLSQNTRTFSGSVPVESQGQPGDVIIKWDDAAKMLSLEPASKQTASRAFKIEIIPDGVTKKIRYTGQRLELKF